MGQGVSAFYVGIVPGKNESKERNTIPYGDIGWSERANYNKGTCDKLEKGVWGMPRLSEAMKDVISCDKPRSGAHTH